MNNLPPRKKIPPRLLASSGNNVPYLLYGWPFNKNYMVEYARRHHLVYPTTEYNRKAFGGIDEFHFDQLTDDDLKDESKMPGYRMIALNLVNLRLIRATGLHLERGRPFTSEYDDMLALYSNRTIEEHIAIPELLRLFDKGKAIIHAAMNEGNTGNEIELRWWWSSDGSGVVRDCRLRIGIIAHRTFRACSRVSRELLPRHADVYVQWFVLQAPPPLSSSSGLSTSNARARSEPSVVPSLRSLMMSCLRRCLPTKLQLGLDCPSRTPRL